MIPRKNERVEKYTLIESMEVDIESLKRDKEANFKERLEFIDKYAEWLKANPNKVWSKQHKESTDSAFKKS